GRALILVDDLHRLGTDDKVILALRGLLDQGLTPVPIVTCGPTPERQAFERERDARNVFAVVSTRVRSPSSEERKAFCECLGQPVLATQDEDGLLVELLFELDVGEPVAEFARNFQRRLARVGLEKQVLSVLAVNAIDFPAHPSLVTDERGNAFIERL